MQKLLGCHNALAFDLTAACSGFVLGLVTATRFIRGMSFDPETCHQVNIVAIYKVFGNLQKFVVDSVYICLAWKLYRVFGQSVLAEHYKFIMFLFYIMSIEEVVTITFCSFQLSAFLALFPDKEESFWCVRPWLKVRYIWVCLLIYKNQSQLVILLKDQRDVGLL